jgi:hypothetical protein
MSSRCTIEQPFPPLLSTYMSPLAFLSPRFVIFPFTLLDHHLNFSAILPTPLTCVCLRVGVLCTVPTTFYLLTAYPLIPSLAGYTVGYIYLHGHSLGHSNIEVPPLRKNDLSHPPFHHWDAA